MSHILDRPIWNALTGPQAHLSEGGALAYRFPPSIVPFAAVREADAAGAAALAALPRAGEEMLQIEVHRPPVPPGFAVAAEATLVQMVLRAPSTPQYDPRIAPLLEADASEMLALAALTRPGPFTLRAQALGTFFGIRIDGRIAAMAGVRMRQAGYWEMSGVCCHPDFRGRGLARALSLFMTGRIRESGDVPYLHAYATNAAAIRLYESIGYEVRTTLNAVIIRAP